MNFQYMKGQGIGNLGVALVIAAVVLIIGVFTYSQIYTAIPKAKLSATANSTLSTIDTTTYNAFNLGVVGLIVLAAVAVLGYIFLLGKRD